MMWFSVSELGISLKMLIFANTYHSQKPDMGYVGVIFIEKAFTNALSWHSETSQLSNLCQEWSNGRCLMVCLCIPIISHSCWCFVHHWQLLLYWFVIYMSAWGFCIARSTEMGNAKASECGTGSMYRFSRFFVFIMPNMENL